MRLDNTNKAAGRSGKGPSEVISRYLEAIYYMETEGESVRSARLADWLGVSRPTVTVALRRMIRDDMVRIDARKEIVLTESGREAASAIVRRHRIMERWLTDALGLDWVQADEEAARLEHAISELVEMRLYEALGRPTTCPHGNPIPGWAEPRPDECRLWGLEAGSQASVTRISEVAEREAPTLLAYLLEEGLVPGRGLEVVEVDKPGRSLRVQTGGRHVTLSQDTADKIWVAPG